MDIAEDKKTVFSHQVRGQHVYGGIIYQDVIPVKSLEAIKDFRFRDDDILCVTYPKSGTTWISSILVQLRPPAEDFTQLRTVTPIIEFHRYHDGRPSNQEIIEARKSPRIIMTHLMPNFFEEPLKHGNPKVIVLQRNPKDTLVSYYHHYRSCEGTNKFQGSFSEFYQMHKHGHVILGDYFQHTIQWWETYRSDPRFLWLKYEDMKKNLAATIRNMVEFLGLQTSEKEIADITESAQFEKMKENPKVNLAGEKSPFDSKISPYMRSGTVGSWMGTISEEENAEIDAKCREDLEPLGIHFVFEL